MNNTVGAEPTEPGWYRSVRGSDYLLYSMADDVSLDGEPHWFAHTVSGMVTPCTWSYIEQAGPVEQLPAVVAALGRLADTIMPAANDEQLAQRIRDIVDQAPPLRLEQIVILRKALHSGQQQQR